jgi:hypothetical protein
LFAQVARHRVGGSQAQAGRERGAARAQVAAEFGARGVQ